jgi:hypothetical protein
MQDEERVGWEPIFAAAVVAHKQDRISSNLMLHVLCLDGSNCTTHRCVPHLTFSWHAKAVQSLRSVYRGNTTVHTA